MAKSDLGIDLGTATFVVYQRGKGIIIEEPSVVAIDKNKKNMIAIGKEAKDMLGKTPDQIQIIRPVQDGVIADPNIIEEVLRYFIKKSNSRGFGLYKPSLIIGIPALTTDVERRAVKEAAARVGASKVFLISEPLAAAIGSEIDIAEPNGHMVIDIGGGTTDIAVLSLGGCVISETIKVAGETMDQEIVKYIKRRYKFFIGEATAERLKTEIGKAHPSEENFETEVKGQNLKTGLPSSIVINSEDILNAIRPVLNEIINKIKNILEKTPPELSADIMMNGLIVVGGTARLRGLDKLISEQTGIKTHIPEDPHLTCAKGTGILLENIELLNKVQVS
ncbi:MAG: rod shape-determining protein [Defluviitoga tunisiensis]|jgi:rod shape-determining protein MreB|uniref:Cell shape-determining protein MreB n=1 Tax=Defluviitoga tunisiensis TaxID=1006576 RepID=A0A0C7NIB2_DEFTU|nr:rod shape-determining protein [Defluviitoga tunisiensis]MDD3600593.1 rod shape-determining protein [Defluviitoga tunisiensis]MDY0378936.1 rod shape-determining protein [Defluviitoga tunisiensis]CEP77706.1 rod shape-determining protein MreB [Defluviitoga tunisiensis]HHV01624.1 rod shape-determining protein [Defluviitoga tunisiensis]HOB55474.1 rod shape-determining protein [Defluviitoga tunisiensis]